MDDKMKQLRATIANLLESAQFELLMNSCKATLAEARKAGDKSAETLALIGLSQAQKFAGKFYEARILADGALELAKMLDDDELGVLALLTSASLHLAANFQSFEAERDYRLALNMAHELGDMVLVADGLAGLASVYMQLGDTQRAGRYAREAISAAQDANYRYGIAIGLSLAGSAAVTSQADKALQAFEDALAIAKEEGFVLVELALIGNIGQLIAEEGRYRDDGIKMLEKSMGMAKEVRSVPHEFTALYRLGRVYETKAELDEAARVYGDMLERAQSWGARSYEGVAFFNLGISAYGRQHHDDAVANFEQALGIARETKNPYQEAQIEQALGAAYSHSHDWDAALSHYMAARSLYDSLDNHAMANSLLQSILLIYVNRLWAKLLSILGFGSKEEQE
jgi:tetratricopeptide (TPR) repeat protein